jgi:hypothetical protein
LPAALNPLEGRVVASGGRVIGCYRDPFGGRWQCLAVLPLEALVGSVPEHELKPRRVRDLVDRIRTLGRFLDPPICVLARDGRGFELTEGYHRFAAMRTLEARSIVVLLALD